MSGRLRKGFGASVVTPRFMLPLALGVLVVAFLFWFIGRTP